MRRILFFCVLLLSTQVLFSQSNNDLIKGFFLKYRLYPTSIVDFFIDSQIDKEIKTIKVTQNDSINYELRFTNNKLSMVIFDSTSMSIEYRLGKITKIRYFKNDSLKGKTKFARLFPFEWILNDGLQNISISGLNGIVKFKCLTGLQTSMQTKIRYKKGRISRTKHYDWWTVSQKCYYSGYAKYQYPNDSTVIVKSYDQNDSLAIEQTSVFDCKANILKTSSLIKKRATGWGIDITYYAYDGNETEVHIFDYQFDDRKNWTERIEYVDDTIRNKTIRMIEYNN